MGVLFGDIEGVVLAIAKSGVVDLAVGKPHPRGIHEPTNAHQESIT